MQGWRALLCGAAVAVALALPTIGPVAPAPTGPETVAVRSRPPNVLIVLTDDQRAGTLGVMRQTRRWFVARGTRFPRAYVTTPLCCPSRSSILTGRYVHNHHVKTNLRTKKLNTRSIFARYLQEAGYRTALFGKFLNVWPIRIPPPFFDRWALFRPAANCYYDCLWSARGGDRRRAGYSTDLIARWGRRFVAASEADDDRPWALVLSVSAPHRYYLAAKRHAHARVPGWRGNPAVRERDKNDKPAYVQASTQGIDEGQAIRQGQLRTLVAVDDLVGSMARTLRRLGEQRRTLAFYLSDNGYHWGEHGLIGKTPPYIPSVRIPLLVRWPGRIEAGAVDRRLAANIDIAPTILDAAGLEARPRIPMDGRSLLRDWTRRRLFLEYTRYSEFPPPSWESLLTRKFQYVEYLLRGRVSFREYYNLVRDPWQRRNLLEDGNPSNDPDIEALHAAITSDRKCVGSRCP